MMPKPPSSNADFTPAAALSLLPFEAALFVVSNFLAEAQIAQGEQNTLRQRDCYAAAEACALQCGYTELIQLVWGDAQNAPPISPPCLTLGVISPHL